jgi:hypothetical protein
MKKFYISLTVVLTFLLLSGSSFKPIYGNNPEISGEVSDTLKGLYSLFDDEEILDVTLKFDMATLLRKKPDSPPLDAEMVFHFNATDSLTRKVTVRPRGYFRLQTCSFPPIMINFKKSVHIGPDSLKFKKMKLVTHCNNGRFADDYVAREYLTYKLYNVLTDSSLRVRILRINYVDTESKRKPVMQYGFIIEPVEVLAERTNSVEVDANNLNMTHIIPDVMDRIGIFMYMVANWDWSIPWQHNVAVIKPLSMDSGGLAVGVPFDFDLTGLVNVSYASEAAPQDVEIKTPRERVFKGICRTEEGYRKALMEYADKKEEMMAVINDFPYIADKSKKDIISFLDQFFEMLEKPRSFDYLISTFRAACKDK